MKIKDFIQRGRELYVQCPGPHDNSGLPSMRRVPSISRSSIRTWITRS